MSRAAAESGVTLPQDHGGTVNETPSEPVYLQSAVARTIGTEETYVVMCRPLNNGAYVLEYVERGREAKLLAAVRVDMPAASSPAKP